MSFNLQEMNHTLSVARKHYLAEMGGEFDNLVPHPDVKTKRAVETAWKKNKDFISQVSRAHISPQDFKDDKSLPGKVKIRFKGGDEIMIMSTR